MYNSVDNKTSSPIYHCVCEDPYVLVGILNNNNFGQQVSIKF